MSIFYANDNFDFTKIKLSNPNGIQGGSYFCKLTYNDEELVIQTPKISTKNGIVTTGKKIYSDLQLNNNNCEFIEWLDNLEKYLQNIIFEKKDSWFQSDLTLDDIEYFFNKTYRTYKNNNYLVRCFIKQSKNFKNIETFTIYNEKEELLSINDVNKDDKIISIIEIAGIKFTNTEFRVEINLKQVMVFQNTLAFNKCLIKSNLEKQEINVSQVNTNNSMELKIDNEHENESEPLSEIDIEVETEVNSQLENNIKLEKDTIFKEETDVYNDDIIKKEDSLEEISLEIPQESNSITLKKPIDIYLELYNNALEKAKKAKESAIKCFLEAKQIKQKYLLDNIELSDNENEILESLTED